MASIAINGLGRIGRAALKILKQAAGPEVVAVNDLVPPDNLAYLLRYDTVYGRWHTTVTADSDALIVGGRKVPALAMRDPAGLPWKTLDVDLVLVMSWYDNEWGFTRQMIREAFTALGLPPPDLSQVRP
ncbi:MAG: glyceraldehyde 3-phosphate dehydrogenase NAD-binding domain-containing protein [Streptosporangiaceae bacterium]